MESMCSPCEVLTIVWTTALLCGQPPYLTNGSYSGAATAYPGSLYDYSCDVGYLPVGDNAANLQVECLDNGKFNLIQDQLPTCIRVCPTPLATNAMTLELTNEVLNDTMVSGTVYSVTCDANHTVSDYQLASTTCDDGNWSPLPTCEKDCGIADDIISGMKTVDSSVDVTHESGVRTLEHNVTYSCLTNYTLYPESSRNVECGMNGLFEPAYPTCFAECGAPPSIGNDSFEFTVDIQDSLYIAGAEVTYTCNETYILAPAEDNVLTCGSDGDWDGTLGACHIECGAPPSIGNDSFEFTVDIQDSLYIAGAEVTYTCNEMYILAPTEDNVLTCGSDGDWDGTLGACHHKACGIAPDLENGTKKVTSYRTIVGTNLTLEMTVEYSCPTSNRTLVPDVTEWTCMDGDVWSHSTPPECLLECGAPPSIGNGSFEFTVDIQHSLYIAGAEVTYTCNETYILAPVEDNVLTCGSDGDWDGTLGACHIECGTPPSIGNGTFEDIKDSLYIFGAEVTYTCNISYVLAPAEDNVLTCGSDRDWYGTLGACRYIACGVAPDLEYGTKNVTSYRTSVGSNLTLEMTVEYSCPTSSNRTLVPYVTEWTCMDGVVWSHSTPPECLLECAIAPSSSHGDVVVISSVYPDRWFTGTTVEYECKEFYVTSNDTIATCEDDGQWNITVPDCQLEWSEYRHCSVNYTFFLTETTGNFNETRAMCQAEGADLMHENFGYEPNGNKYFEVMRALTEASDAEFITLGMTDQLEENVWRFVDGTIFDPDVPKDKMFVWGPAEPNNWDNREHCVVQTNRQKLNDVLCSAYYVGFCEAKNITCVEL